MCHVTWTCNRENGSTFQHSSNSTKVQKKTAYLCIVLLFIVHNNLNLIKQEQSTCEGWELKFN